MIATGIGFGAGSGFSYTKGSIGFQRQGSYGTGDLVFLTNNDQNTTGSGNQFTEKMRITYDRINKLYTLSGSYYINCISQRWFYMYPTEQQVISMGRSRRHCMD